MTSEVEHPSETKTDEVSTEKLFDRSGPLEETPPHKSQVPLIKLELENITYSPLTKKTSSFWSLFSGEQKEQRKTVLHNITTRILPHEVTAWMGPSGSGKTSLLTVAANLIGEDKGSLSADSTILVNGEEGEMPKKLVGVVWQDDLLLSNLTVTENVWYAARLKTLSSVSDEKVRELVHETLRDLDLIKIQDSIVGGMQRRGISGGERKRVAVASELVIRPSLLFLDEPTSGLDATTALSLMQMLKTLARTQGHSIVAVLHQPRTTIFNSCIDSLLLLSSGRVVYNGPPSQVRTYFEDCCGGTVTPLPPETGIADWIMDIIKEDEQLRKKKTIEAKDEATPSCLADYWQNNITNNSHLPKGGKSIDHDEAQVHKRMNSLKELKAMPKYNSSFWTQFRLLTLRTGKQQRGDRLTATAAAMQFAYLFFTAILWWRLPDTSQYIFERSSLLFFMVVAQANGVVVNAVSVFATERVLLRRERGKKMYGVASYFLAKTISDMTNNVLLPMLYVMVVYWTAGFRLGAVAYLKYILAFYLTISTAQSMGLALSVLFPNVQMAVMLAPALTLFFIIMGGFYVPLENMNVAIKWSSWISFCRYGYSALLINEFAGRSIPCSSSSSGALHGSTYTACPVPGEAILTGLGINGVTQEFWFNIGMVSILQIFFRVWAYWLLRGSR